MTYNLRFAAQKTVMEWKLYDASEELKKAQKRLALYVSQGPVLYCFENARVEYLLYAVTSQNQTKASFTQ